MPLSPIHKIWPVMSIFRHLPIPNSVLDIGAGFGKYGVILREHLDIRLQRYNKEDWKTIIDAVDIWPQYITPIHRYVYDTIFIGEALQVVKRLTNYDVFILVEVLEHLSKDTGKELLGVIYRKCNFGISMSFPNSLPNCDRNNWPNPHERHLSVWGIDELIEMFGTDHVKAVGKLAYQIIK